LTARNASFSITFQTMDATPMGTTDIKYDDSRLQALLNHPFVEAFSDDKQIQDIVKQEIKNVIAWENTRQNHWVREIYLPKKYCPKGFYGSYNVDDENRGVTWKSAERSFGTTRRKYCLWRKNNDNFDDNRVGLELVKLFHDLGFTIEVIQFYSHRLGYDFESMVYESHVSRDMWQNHYRCQPPYPEDADDLDLMYCNDRENWAWYTFSIICPEGQDWDTNDVDHDYDL
jgi:hypothetical protein